MKYFETRFLEEAEAFIAGLDSKTVRKIFYNIDLAEHTNDPKLLKKIQNDIWEFRIRYAGKHFRLLAFWDKSNYTETLVIATHGFVKKVNKIPIAEIDRALRLREKYFKHKLKT